MVRTRIKGNGMKAAASPNTEPDFYAMGYCHERNNYTNKIVLDNEEFEPMVSGETTDDEVDCSSMKQDDREPDRHAWDFLSSIVTPESSQQIRKSNTAVLKKLEWPSCLAAPFGEVWPSSDGDGMLLQPRLNLMNQPSIPKKTTSEALSLAFMMAPPPMMIAALHQSDVDEEDWVRPPMCEGDCSVIDEGDEVFFDGHEFLCLNEQGEDRVSSTTLLPADEKQQHQHPEDMISASRFGSI